MNAYDPPDDRRHRLRRPDGAVRRPDCGGVVLFLGTVRDLTDGRVTVALDYEAYPGMAEKKLAEIEQETRRRWPVGEIALVHRLGRLDVGEVSVAVAVSCPHRAEAFEACRFAIDRLKELVPIWKKENWADGRHGMGASSKVRSERARGERRAMSDLVPLTMRGEGATPGGAHSLTLAPHSSLAHSSLLTGFLRPRPQQPAHQRHRPLQPPLHLLHAGGGRLHGPGRAAHV